MISLPRVSLADMYPKKRETDPNYLVGFCQACSVISNWVRLPEELLDDFMTTDLLVMT